jgi:hypothetical protein
MGRLLSRLAALEGGEDGKAVAPSISLQERYWDALRSLWDSKVDQGNAGSVASARDEAIDRPCH